MKHFTHYMIVSMMLVCLAAVPAMAQQDHDSNTQKIHHATVDDHELAYELIDMRQTLKEHGGDSEATHHLMVYIKASNGNTITGAKTGFLIRGPEGEQQKEMAMGMGEGYGADVSLDPAGQYTIKTKVVAGEKTLLHSFDHVVE